MSGNNQALPMTPRVDSSKHAASLASSPSSEGGMGMEGECP